MFVNILSSIKQLYREHQSPYNKCNWFWDFFDEKIKLISEPKKITLVKMFNEHLLKSMQEAFETCFKAAIYKIRHTFLTPPPHTHPPICDIKFSNWCSLDSAWMLGLYSKNRNKHYSSIGLCKQQYNRLTYIHDNKTNTILIASFF